MLIHPSTSTEEIKIEGVLYADATPVELILENGKIKNIMSSEALAALPKLISPPD